LSPPLLARSLWGQRAGGVLGVVRRVALVAIRAPYLYHFAAAKQSTTRVARIEKAMPAIFEGRGFLERR